MNIETLIRRGMKKHWPEFLPFEGEKWCIESHPVAAVSRDDKTPLFRSNWYLQISTVGEHGFQAHIVVDRRADRLKQRTEADIDSMFDWIKEHLCRHSGIDLPGADRFREELKDVIDDRNKQAAEQQERIEEWKEQRLRQDPEKTATVPVRDPRFARSK